MRHAAVRLGLARRAPRTPESQPWVTRTENIPVTFPSLGVIGEANGLPGGEGGGRCLSAWRMSEKAEAILYAAAGGTKGYQPTPGGVTNQPLETPGGVTNQPLVGLPTNPVYRNASVDPALTGACREPSASSEGEA